MNDQSVGFISPLNNALFPLSQQISLSDVEKQKAQRSVSVRSPQTRLPSDHWWCVVWTSALNVVVCVTIVVVPSSSSIVWYGLVLLVVDSGDNADELLHFTSASWERDIGE